MPPRRRGGILAYASDSPRVPARGAAWRPGRRHVSRQRGLEGARVAELGGRRVLHLGDAELTEETLVELAEEIGSRRVDPTILVRREGRAGQDAQRRNRSHRTGGYHGNNVDARDGTVGVRTAKPKSIVRFLPHLGRVVIGLPYFITGLNGLLNVLPQPDAQISSGAAAFAGALVSTGLHDAVDRDHAACRRRAALVEPIRAARPRVDRAIHREQHRVPHVPRADRPSVRHGVSRDRAGTCSRLLAGIPPDARCARDAWVATRDAVASVLSRKATKGSLSRQGRKSLGWRAILSGASRLRIDALRASDDSPDTKRSISISAFRLSLSRKIEATARAFSPRMNRTTTSRFAASPSTSIRSHFSAWPT